MPSGVSFILGVACGAMATYLAISKSVCIFGHCTGALF